MKANGTVAKDIAIYFFDATETRYTSSMIAKTIIQAKHLLEAGYTQDEIESAIDWVVNKTKVKMYSLGYINTMINRILENIEEEKQEEELIKKQQEIKEKFEQAMKEHMEKQSEVGDNDKSETSNRDKVNRFGIESRFGEKFNFDMLKESGKDN